MKISVIIPTYNEETVISQCLISLSKQTKLLSFEVIIVDDGSTDNTVSKITAYRSEKYFLKLLKQKHLGPGAARNLGANEAKGDILVFVDADMEFAPDFLEKLVAPISSGKTVGTNSSKELLLNTDNPWAVCWNLNFTHNSSERLISIKKTSVLRDIYSQIKTFLEGLEANIAPIDHSQVTKLGKGESHFPFRAILKDSFLSVGGFETNVGYTDDWTIAEKLGRMPLMVPAVYYHRNPASLLEIWRQARWLGKDQLNTGNIVRQIHAAILYNPLSALIKSFVWALKFKQPRFIVFKIVYDTAVFTSVLLSFFGESKAK